MSRTPVVALLLAIALVVSSACSGSAPAAPSPNAPHYSMRASARFTFFLSRWVGFVRARYAF